MTSITRRERQRLENREGILKAALTIAERESWSAVTIRKIADEIDYTSPIIYQHFDNKEAALQALIEQGFNDLETSMRRALMDNDPETRLLALGRAYLHFARDHRRLYELMHGLGGGGARAVRAHQGSGRRYHTVERGNSNLGTSAGRVPGRYLRRERNSLGRAPRYDDARAAARYRLRACRTVSSGGPFAPCSSTGRPYKLIFFLTYLSLINNLSALQK